MIYQGNGGGSELIQYLFRHIQLWKFSPYSNSKWHKQKRKKQVHSPTASAAKEEFNWEQIEVLEKASSQTNYEQICRLFQLDFWQLKIMNKLVR